MAKHNPFRMFRKNQKAWLAGLTLFTMFSFIALGSMFQCLQVSTPQQQAAQSLYATTKTVGNIDHWLFLQEQQSVQALSAFLEAATMRLVQERVVIPYGDMLLVMQQDPASGQQFPVLLDNLTHLFQELAWTLSDSQNVVERWLAVQLGRKRGFSADESNVRGYLSLMFQDKLTPEDLDAALGQAGMNQYQLVLLLEDQIVYERMIRTADGGRRTDALGQAALPTGHGSVASTPADALAAGERLYRKVKTAVASFDAARYADQIPDPTDETLRAFYEKYKYLPNSATSETPGFYLPTKAAFEVVRGTLTEERLAAVTDEEIAKYYDEHKEEFAKPVAPTQSGPTGPVPGAMTDADLLSLPTDAPVSDVAPPAETAPADAAPVDAAPADAAPADAAPADAAPAESAPESTATEEISPFKLVAYQEEAPDETAPAETTPAETTPAETASTVGYYTLDEVKEDIRRKIAGDKLLAEMETIYTQMDDYAGKLAKKRANVGGKSEELVELKLQELATAAGFDYFATTATAEDGSTISTMVDYVQASSMKLLPETVLQEVYSSTPMEYSPVNTGLVVDTVSLYWATEVKGAHLPEYDDSKDLALSLWKKQEGILLAEKDAEAFAAKARADGKTLEQLAAEAAEPKNFDFVKTESFTGFDFPRGFRTPSLSFGEIREEGVPFGEADAKNKVVVAPGKAFYDTVYNLELNGVGVVRNQPLDRVFVVQLIEADSDETLLEKMKGFDDDAVARQALMTWRQMKNLDFQNDWIEQLKKEAGFEWVVIPREVRD